MYYKKVKKTKFNIQTFLSYCELSIDHNKKNKTNRYMYKDFYQRSSMICIAPIY